MMGIKASKGKDGKFRIHCSDCGRFVIPGEPKPVPKEIFGDNPVFSEDAPEDIAGKPIRSVADAVCSKCGAVEAGAFFGA